MLNQPFRHDFKVTQADIDELDHINNASYLRWIQEAVVAHWKAFADPDMQRRYLWIAVRHEIDYLKEGFINDSLIAVTVLTSASAVRVCYVTEILRRHEALIRARSTWCCIDATTRRPVKMGCDIKRSFGLIIP